MNETDTQLTQAILQILITVIVPVLAAFVATWLRKQTQLIQLQMTAEQRMYVDALVRSFVAAAEQYDLAGLAKRSGQQKKAWVVERTQEALQKAGVDWNAQVIADAVEAAILTGAKQTWPPVVEVEPAQS